MNIRNPQMPDTVKPWKPVRTMSARTLKLVLATLGIGLLSACSDPALTEKEQRYSALSVCRACHHLLPPPTALPATPLPLNWVSNCSLTPS